MYAQQKTWLPSASDMGLGQAGMCPSLNQLMGCPVPDACCNPTTGATFDSAGNETCYNTSTGATVACPTSGTLVGTSPSGQGPFGTMGTVTNLNWGLLAAVLAGFVVLAAVSGK